MATNKPKMNKVLIMGKSNVGKTSMKSIIFANYLAKDTSRLGPTIKIQQSHLRLLGDLQVNVWDCGGNSVFLKCYFKSQRDFVFKNVAVLIYVFDIQSLQKQNILSLTGIPDDFYDFNNALGAIHQYSPNAKIFCLINKMDTINPQTKHQEFKKYCLILQQEAKSFNLNIICFCTSIWDETLFKAWSYIVRSLLTDQTSVQKELDILCTKSQTNELILFESSTLLFIAHSCIEMYKNMDNERFEKISNIIKQFKIKCNKHKGRYLFESMTVSNSKFTVYIGPFTDTTYIAAIVSNSKIEIEAVKLNLKAAKQRFTKMLRFSI